MLLVRVVKIVTYEENLCTVCIKIKDGHNSRKNWTLQIPEGVKHALRSGLSANGNRQGSVGDSRLRPGRRRIGLPSSTGVRARRGCQSLQPFWLAPAVYLSRHI